MPKQVLSLLSLQSMRVAVNGPNDANTLIITTGLAVCELEAINHSPETGHTIQQQGFSALVEPRLKPEQFRRAIATASLATISFGTTAHGTFCSFSVDSVDADLDDESGSVELRFDLSVQASSSTASIVTVAFQVTTLASL
jgi:hypothetical protein